MEAINVAVVAGRLSRPAEERVLPSGDRLVGLEVTVAREGARADTVPVVWIGSKATSKATVASLDVDDEVVVVGRVRRRFFKAGGATASRTEVVADAVLRPRQAKQVRAALTGAARTIEGSG